MFRTVLCCFAGSTAIQFQWKSALSLAVYLLGFSLAYLHVDAGIGALILFGAVQITMISYAILHGERMTLPRWVGLGCAILGMGLLLCLKPVRQHSNMH